MHARGVIPMAGTNAVWGIEIGQCALKAMKLRPSPDGKMELLAFDVIEHPKLLSQPDADAEELMRAALEKFASRNEWQGDKFVIGVPGHQTFARFCKLPPVDEKKIPDIVRFEASQQIPFNMEDVVWDYEVFRSEDMPDVEVGIFAMRKDLIRKHLERFAAIGVTPIAIQTVPSALYNFSRFEGMTGKDEGVATVIIDVGAQHTDLVIVEQNSAWTRNIPLGGNSFTEALVKAFKLSFAKAESLKRSAATSKYARQVFQAMRPIFADLVAEIQRSLGFFASTHREVQLRNVIACGNAFKLPGLQKYLENNLTIDGGVQKLESFTQISPSATVNAPQFTESIAGLGPAYGLALQGLGLGTITSNLLPPELARIAMWQKKRPMFVGAAAAIGLAAIIPWARNSMDIAALAAHDDKAREAIQIVNRVSELQQRYRQAQTDTSGQAARVEQVFNLLDQRDIVPRVLAFVHETLPEVDPQLAAVRSPEDFKKLVAANPARYQRTNRRQIYIEHLEIEFVPDIDNFDPSQRRGTGYGFGGGGGGVDPIEEDPMAGGGGFMMGGGGGRGRMTEPPPPPPRPTQQQEASDSPVGPGFYVSISGYFPYGETQSQASMLIADEFNPTILQLGNRPGLGFYVPKNDPKSPTGENLRLPVIVRRFDASSGLLQPGMGAAAPGAPGSDRPEAMFPDPVTGEDMITDWRFQTGFKIKLGDPPPADTGDGQPEGE